jgi:hypothetical protein
VVAEKAGEGLVSGIIDANKGVYTGIKNEVQELQTEFATYWTNKFWSDVERAKNWYQTATNWWEKTF